MEMSSEPELTKNLILDQDIIVVATGHTNIDYHFVNQWAKKIFDIKNVLKDIADRSKIELL